VGHWADMVTRWNSLSVCSGEGSQYIRDAMLGVTDGLLSTLLLVLGVAGGTSGTSLSGTSSTDHWSVLLAGVSAAVAGAVSMALGEMVATKTQNGESVLPSGRCYNVTVS
jgi:hypothetical protein